MRRQTRRFGLVGIFGVVAAVGCTSSDTSAPEAIVKKFREAQNTYVLPTAPSAPAATDGANRTRFVLRSHEDWTIPQTAVFALGRIGPAAVPALLQAMRSADPYTRRQAMETLSRIGPEAAEAVPELTRSLGDPDPAIRKAAARALGQIGPAAAEAVPALVRVMQESD